MGKVKKNAQGAKAKKKSTKVQIRGIERLLKNAELPCEVRQSKERMLEMLRGDHTDHKRKIKQQQLQKKYKMVRFFEKRKLRRKLEQCNKKIASASAEDRPALEEKLAELQKDYNYVEHFPVSKKYISIVSTDQTENTIQEKGEIRQQIAEKVVAGSLCNAATRFADDEDET